MKHLALDFHFVREKVQSGTLRVTHISGEDQLANLLTKPVLRPRFNLLSSKIGLTLDSSMLQGNVKSQPLKHTQNPTDQNHSGTKLK